MGAAICFCKSSRPGRRPRPIVFVAVVLRGAWLCLTVLMKSKGIGNMYHIIGLVCLDSVQMAAHGFAFGGLDDSRVKKFCGYLVEEHQKVRAGPSPPSMPVSGT